MDFIEGLPKSKGKDAIVALVDRFTKYGHFFTLSHPFSASVVAQKFLNHIYKLHGLSQSSDRDKVFTSHCEPSPPFAVNSRRQLPPIVDIADKIHSKMGEATFCQVLECWDRDREEMVAIKIVRGVKKYRDAAMIEVEVLQQLGKHDKVGYQYGIGLTIVTQIFSFPSLKLCTNTEQMKKHYASLVSFVTTKKRLVYYF
ncbi:Serine/threonine-protein kinase AFC2 [Abeliophyllum distichum]|uniref:Serine/threonine-protein kinase AFC2 n=1 Tax=Abeliophyllum distichum TaxID=126358 RepID=A0ABD1UPM3_9LAMI